MAGKNNNQVYKKCPICEREIRSNGMSQHMAAHKRRGETKDADKEPAETDSIDNSNSKNLPDGRDSGRGDNTDIEQENKREGVNEMDNENSISAEAVAVPPEQTIRIIEGNPAPAVPAVVEKGLDKFLDKHGDELMGIAAAVIGTIVQGMVEKKNDTPETQEGMITDILGNKIQDF